MKPSELIRAKRTALGLTQQDVADYVGVARQTISRWEIDDGSDIGVGKIAKLAEILQISPLVFILDISREDEDSNLFKAINLISQMTEEEWQILLQVFGRKAPGNNNGE